MDIHRTFIAIELPHDLRGVVRDHISQLRKKVPDASASWSREDNLHLTLKFFGDVPVSRIAYVTAAASAAVKARAPFELVIAGCGVFPRSSKPNILWIGVEDASDALHKLQKNLEDEAAARGFAPERRGYHPHLTIARIRHPLGARELADAHLSFNFPRQGFTATELVVFRSDLLPGGSRHTPISHHAFS